MTFGRCTEAVLIGDYFETKLGWIGVPILLRSKGVGIVVHVITTQQALHNPVEILRSTIIKNVQCWLNVLNKV